MGSEEARLAQEILDNPVFNQAIADIKADILKKWSSSDAFDKDGREMAFVYFRSIDMLHNKLSGYINKHLAEVHRTEQLTSVDEYSIA